MKVEDLVKSRHIYFRYVRKHCPVYLPPSDADDIVQNTLIYISKRFKNKELKGSYIGELIYKKLDYGIQDFLKTRVKSCETTLDDIEEAEKEFKYYELFSEVPEILFNLTSARRAQFLQAYYLSGMSYREIAKRYEVTPGTVKKALFEGKKQIFVSIDRLREAFKILDEVWGKNE